MLSLKKGTVRNFVSGAMAAGALIVALAPGRAIAAENGAAMVVQAPQANPVPQSLTTMSTHGCDVC